MPKPEHSEQQRSLRGLARYYRRRAPQSRDEGLLDRLSGDGLLSRCQDLNLRPKRILDLGARKGALSVALAQRYPEASVLALECSAEMLACVPKEQPGNCQFLASEAWPLPLADESFDLVVANLTASLWPEGVIGEGLRTLRSGGALLLSAFGSRTLVELRRQCPASGPGLRLRPGLDVMELGDHIIASQGQEPVVDSQDHHLAYEDLAQLRLDSARLCLSHRSADGTPARRIDSLSCPPSVTIEILTAVAFKPSRPSGAADL